MKKLILFNLFALGLVLSGCGQAELKEPLTRNYETYIGEIQSLGGVRVNKTITHLFETEDGDILYAYSDRYDLEDERYFNTPVEAYGLVMTFEDVDKEVFEIRTLSDAPEKDDSTEEVETVEYLNESLGFQVNYFSNWDLTENSDGITLMAPLVLPEETESASGSVTEDSTDEDSSQEAGVPADPDYVVISKVYSGLKKTSDDSQEVRATEIRDYVRNNYDSLVGVSSDLAYVGVDRQLGVRYKTLSGDISYFVPRGADLFEISFYHPSEEDKVDNANVFAEMVQSFRFYPSEGNSNESVVEEKVEESAEMESEEEDSGSEDAAVAVVVSGYREFESNPFKFKISYPSAWYYSGGTTGYDFSDEPIEDDTPILIRLEIGSSGTVGKSKSGATVKITVKVEDRYYTLSGGSDYESVMQVMADSIQAIEPDQES